MAEKMKKSVKRRGHRVQGKGGLKKWSGKGHRGGKGFSGSKKHKKSWINRHKPDHLGKKGFKSKTGKDLKTINLNDVERLAGDKKEINLSEMGYDKVLGRGKITKPLTIKADYFSKKATEKIEAAKGKIVE